MYEAVMMAATGLTSQQRRLDTIADNIANTNTTGFKASRLDFKDALYTAWLGPAATPDGNQLKGHGVMVGSITKGFESGAMLSTGGRLDFALERDGFFEVSMPDGTRAYTRAGNFYLSAEEDGQYLVNAHGHYVLNSQGERIQLPDGISSVSASVDGTVRFSNGETETEDRLGIYTFPNKMGLSSIGGGYYQETETSGGPVEAPEAGLRQGMLEASNVDMAAEMTRMIRAQRAFSLAGRALTTADEMEGIANNLRR